MMGKRNTKEGTVAQNHNDPLVKSSSIHPIILVPVLMFIAAIVLVATK